MFLSIRGGYNSKRFLEISVPEDDEARAKDAGMHNHCRLVVADAEQRREHRPDFSLVSSLFLWS